MNPLDLILIIDDDAFAVKVVTSQLHKLGYQNTIGITAPLEALEYLREHKSMVKTIVCDLQMPGLDGIELARRGAEADPAMKIVFITGFAAVALSAQSQAPKDAKVLSKPFHLKDLVVEIERVIAAA